MDPIPGGETTTAYLARMIKPKPDRLAAPGRSLSYYVTSPAPIVLRRPRHP